MFIAKLPPLHVEYLRACKDDAFAYLFTDEFKRPPGLLERLFGRRSPGRKRPENWPTVEAERIQLDENLGTDAKAMHYFLNGTDRPVEGPSNLFQAWLLGNERSAERLSGRDGYAYLHKPEAVAALLKKLESLDEDTLETRWKDVNARLETPNDAAEYDYISECFARLRAHYKSAASEGASVLWAPQQ